MQVYAWPKSVDCYGICFLVYTTDQLHMNITRYNAPDVCFTIQHTIQQKTLMMGNFGKLTIQGEIIKVKPIIF